MLRQKALYKHKPVRLIVSVVKKLRPLRIVDDLVVEYRYSKEVNRTSFQRGAGVNLAVVIHLYYVESWPYFLEKLQTIGKYPHDIFVSLQASDKRFAAEIKRAYPNAQIFVLPNRGRDVLPFLAIARKVEELGYDTLLKIHSKKSTHRTDGEDWLRVMLESLLPANKVVLQQLLDKLEIQGTGIIGPSGQYLPLTVNFEANGTLMTRIINKIYSKEMSYKILQTNRDQFGFFGGTMFWARLDAISPILNKNFNIGWFEPETGQIDGTFAHALERIFSIVPEIEGKIMYEISNQSIRQIDYYSENIPDWSDVYIGPKS